MYNKKPYKLNEFGSHCTIRQVVQVKQYWEFMYVSIAGIVDGSGVPVVPTGHGSARHGHEVGAAQGRHQQAEYLGYNANQTMPDRQRSEFARPHYNLRKFVLPVRNDRLYLEVFNNNIRKRNCALRQSTNNA